MPSYVLKTSPDADLYVEWSTIVDAPTLIGTRAEFAEHFGTEGMERLARADATGTSAYNGDGKWGDDLIYQGEGWLPRDRLIDAAQLLQRDGGEMADVAKFLRPFDDDE